MLSGTATDNPNIDELIKLALLEDGEDETTKRLVDSTLILNAEVRAKQAGVLCGLSVARKLVELVDPNIQLKSDKQDGDRIAVGSLILELSGSARALMRIERPMLNFMQQLSGVASLTAKFVEAVKGYNVRILDTRKTIPGWRRLQKYAVRTGGGDNHRMRLNDMLLVKENHLKAAGGVAKAVSKIESAKLNLPLEVEASCQAEVDELVRLGVRRIMLDNMTPDEVATIVNRHQGKAEFEVSGGITLDNVVDYAKTGVAYISVGALTHSADALDISMLVKS